MEKEKEYKGTDKEKEPETKWMKELDYKDKEWEEKEEYKEKNPEENPFIDMKECNDTINPCIVEYDDASSIQAALNKDLDHNKAIDQVDMPGLEKTPVIHMRRTHVLHLRRYMWRSRMGKEMRKRRVKQWRRCLTRDKEPGMDTWMGLEFGMSHQWRVRKQKK